MSQMFGNDYRMQHRPPDAEHGAPFYDASLFDHNERSAYPEDVYEHPEWYGNEDGWRESFRAMQAARGNPEHPVTIYRAAPQADFNTGDWVTPSLEYAKIHSRHYEDPAQDMPVHSITVPASQLHTDADSLNEWGYNGPNISGQRVATKTAAIKSRPPKYVQHWVEQTHPDEFQGHPSDCINPKCQHHWTDEDEHQLLQYGQIKCPRCHTLQTIDGNLGGFDDNQKGYGDNPGGGTKSGLSLSDMGRMGQEIVKRAQLPGFTFKHEFTEPNWPIDQVWTDQHGNDWGMEVKAAHHQAQQRFKLGDAAERNKKIAYTGENGLRQGLLGVRMNFATNKADIFHRPQFTDTWVGAPTMHHMGTVDFSDLNPFKDPSEIGQLPQEQDDSLPF